jgi:di/tricarboxylate transporter
LESGPPQGGSATLFVGAQSGGSVLEHSPMNSRSGFVAALALALASVVWWLPLPVPEQGSRTLAISVFVLILWIGQPFPHAVSGLIGCYLVWTLAGLPFSGAFGGFAHSSAWFVLAAGVFGSIASRTGLAHRLAASIMGRTSMSYSRLVLGILLTSLVLNFLVPSGIARVIILGGLALGIVKSVGWDRESLPARGLFVTLTASSTLFDKLMISGNTSIVAQGIIEKIGGTRIHWSEWFVAHLPTLLISFAAFWILVLRLFPSGPDANRSISPQAAGWEEKPWTVHEQKCALILGTAFCLWASDFIHHIHPATIAIGAALVAMLPGAGILQAKELKELDFLPFMFTASALSLGDSLEKTGVLDAVTAGVTGWQPLAGGFAASAPLLYWSAFGYHLLIPSDPTTVVTSMPAVMRLAAANGWNAAAAGLTWTFALAAKLFVYQSGAAIAGFSFGYFKPRDFFKVGACLALIEFAVLILLVAWYWPLIGLTPKP